MKTHNWKSNYFSTLETEIDKIKEEGHYRVFNNIERKAGQYPKATRHHEGNTEEIDVVELEISPEQQISIFN